MLAILGLLAVLAARAAAGPYDPEPNPRARRDEIADADDALDQDTRASFDDPVAAGPDREPAPCNCDRATLAAVLARAPRPAAVIAAAHAAAGLAGDPAPGWRRRARASSLIPSVSARAGNSESWREVTDPTVSHAIAYDVRLSWRLDRLVFDPLELRIAAVDVARRRERRRIAAQATRLLHAWARARATAQRDPRWSEIADEVAGELDILTDGYFSQTLAKGLESR